MLFLGAYGGYASRRINITVWRGEMVSVSFFFLLDSVYGVTVLDPDSENLDMILVPGWWLPTPWGRFSF